MANVYKGRQGTGLATVLGGEQTPDLVLKTELGKDAARKKKLAQAAKKLRGTEIPEHWFKYDKEIQKDFDEMFNIGARLVGQGIDPFTAVTEEAQDFQNRLARLSSKAETSKQLKDYYDEQRTLIQSDPKKYKGWDDLNKFFESNDLGTIMENGLQPPELKRRTPLKNLYTMHRDMISDAIDRNNGIPLNHKQLEDEITFRLQNPEDFEELIETYKAKAQDLQKFSPDEWGAIQERARLYSGGDLLKQMMIEDASMFNRRPLTSEMMVRDLAGEMRVRRTDIERGGVTITSADVTDRQIKDSIRLKLESDPRAWDLAEGKDINEKVNNFFKKNEEAIRSQIAGRRYGRAEDEGLPFGRDEISDNFNKWYRQFKKGYQQAADFLVGTQLPGERLSIYRTDVIGKNKVRVYLRGRALERLQSIAKKSNTTPTSFMQMIQMRRGDLTPEQEEMMKRMTPDVRNDIEELVAEMGAGKYVAKEGAIFREYDLREHQDKERLRDAYKLALERRQDLYLEVDEKKVKPGGELKVPGMQIYEDRDGSKAYMPIGPNQ